MNHLAILTLKIYSSKKQGRSRLTFDLNGWHGEKLISYKLIIKQWLQNTSEKRGELIGEGFLDTSYSGVNIENSKLLQIVNNLVKRFVCVFSIKKL